MLKMILLAALVSIGSTAMAARCDIDAPPECHTGTRPPQHIPASLLNGKVFESKNLPAIEVIEFTHATDTTTLTGKYNVASEATAGVFTASMIGYKVLVVEFRETPTSAATVVEKFEIIQNYVYNKTALKSSTGVLFVQR